MYKQWRGHCQTIRDRHAWWRCLRHPAGTPERKKALADALEKCKDKDLARKFAALALDGLDRFFRRS
jgi:hypothetical protein